MAERWTWLYRVCLDPFQITTEILFNAQTYYKRDGDGWDGGMELWMLTAPVCDAYS